MQKFFSTNLQRVLASKGPRVMMNISGVFDCQNQVAVDRKQILRND